MVPTLLSDGLYLYITHNLGSECKRLCLLKNLGSRHAFLSLPVSWLFASFVSSGQVHAVAIWGVDLPLRNRTSRFRFCAVAAR
jgi:hypothetical protein